MRAAVAFAFIALTGCAHVHQAGKVEIKRDELKGTESQRMSGLYLFETDETRIYMDASYDKPKKPTPPPSVHVVFTIITPWGFEKDLDPTWVVYTDAFRRDWGDLNRDASGVSLSAGGRYRELFSIDVPPLALESIASARSASFRFGTFDVALEANDIMTIRKLVETWQPKPKPGQKPVAPAADTAPADTTAEPPPQASPKAPPLIAPPSDIKI